MAVDAGTRPRPGPAAAPRQSSRLSFVASPLTSAAAQRLGICVVGSLVLAVMTGPPGTNAAPTSGFTGALRFPRLLWFLGLAGVLFAVVSAWKSFGESGASRARRIRSSISSLTARRPVRLAIYAAIVGLGFIWVSWISPNDTWKGGACIEVGCALAAMELLVYLFESRSLRVARPAGYAFMALYGVLAYMHNGVAEYLNTIGAVPHDRTIGVLFLWIALALSVLEGVLFGRSLLQKVITSRRGRGITTVVGLALVAYGWLMWTSWALWRASTPHSVAHWLASIHVLPHNHMIGLLVMALGGAVLACALAWAGTDVARARSAVHVPSAAAMSSPGSRNRRGSPTERPRSRSRRSSSPSSGRCTWTRESSQSLRPRSRSTCCSPWVST